MDFYPNRHLLQIDYESKAYAYALKYIIKTFPKGYIDVSLLLRGLTHQPLSACISAVGKPAFIRELGERPIGGTDYLVELVDGEEGVFPKERIERLFKALHTISETQFAQGHFNVAWDEVLIHNA